MVDSSCQGVRTTSSTAENLAIIEAIAPLTRPETLTGKLKKEVIMFDWKNLRRSAVAATGLVVVFLVMGAMAASALAGDIINDWSTVKAPPIPELKAVTV